MISIKIEGNDAAELAARLNDLTGLLGTQTVESAPAVLEPGPQPEPEPQSEPAASKKSSGGGGGGKKSGGGKKKQPGSEPESEGAATLEDVKSGAARLIEALDGRMAEAKRLVKDAWGVSKVSELDPASYHEFLNWIDAEIQKLDEAAAELEGDSDD